MVESCDNCVLLRSGSLYYNQEIVLCSELANCGAYLLVALLLGIFNLVLPIVHCLKAIAHIVWSGFTVTPRPVNYQFLHHG